MPTGQLKEQMPHCTQRLGSGVTDAAANVLYLVLSDVSQSMATSGIYPDAAIAETRFCPEA